MMALGGSRVEQQRLDLNVGALLPLNRRRIDAAGEVNSTAALAEWAAKWSGLFRLRHGRDALERFEARPDGPMTAAWYR